MRGTLTLPKVRSNLTPPDIIRVAPETLVQRIPIEYDGDGGLEAYASNDNLDVRVDGRTLELTGRKSGTAQLLIRALDGTNYGRTKTQTVDIELQDMPSPVLANNSMSVLQRVTHAGFASVPGWNPGDKMPRRLEGPVGVTDVTGDYYDVLLGINHNPQFELPHSLQFGLAWYAEDAQTPIAFVDDKYGTYYTDERRDFRMNPDYHNLTTGYSGMQLREVIQEFYGAIADEELKKVIVAWRKYIDDGAFIASGVSDPKDVTALQDVITLLRQFDVFPLGASQWEPKSEYATSQMYSIFPDAASRIAYAFNDFTKAVWWWLCSRSTSIAGNFRYVYTGGTTSSNHAYNSCGVRPCYMIG